MGKVWVRFCGTFELWYRSVNIVTDSARRHIVLLAYVMDMYSLWLK